jgi:hypothetical protein
MVVEDRGGKQVQKVKEMGAKGRRMEVWIRTHGFTPYLSSPVSGNPSGVALHAHIAHSAYPGTDKWGQALLISQRWTMKRWCNGAETESPRISYARRPVGSGIMVMITSGAAIFVEQ